MENHSLITQEIHYVGVQDRRTHLFEGLWALPDGISYNSYLIVDEKIALVDSVEAGFFGQSLRKIKRIIGDRPIDYLIINHMEPDHSSSIGLLKKYYPDMILVGNARTFGMLEGFYGVEGEQEVVKMGSKLCLGSRTLEFYITPMLHWPETMMTYDSTSKSLFSGDAFGCFTALSGGIVDSEMHIEPYLDNAVRYYSNIVAKYGPQVQRALQLLKDLDIQYLCTLHGPVWHDQIPHMFDLYDKISLCKAEEGVVIIYGSMYGNTEEMAEEIARELSFNGVKTIKMHNVSTASPSHMLADVYRYNGLIIGSPTYNAELYPGVEAMVSRLKNRGLKNRYFGFFGSFSWAGTAVKLLADFADGMKINVIGAPIEMKQSMTDADRKEVARLAVEMAEAIKTPF
ncbi:MAG: FprA family A-type flavoprotein [Bacteroidaceae bacterium]